MNDLVDAGVGTIVDLTVAGLGRDVALVQRVAEQTALNIVVATGYYTFTELPYFVEVRARFSGGALADMLAGWFVTDITEGIARYWREGGDLEMRDRPSGRDAGSRGGAARRRACTPRDGCSDLDAHRTRHQARARATEGVRVGRCRPDAGRDRPQRRHRRPRVPRRAAGPWLVPRHGPVRAATGSCPSKNGCRRSSSCANAVTSTAWCCRTTRPVTTTGSPAEPWRGRGTTATSPATCSPRCEPPDSAMPSSPRARRQPEAPVRRAGRVLASRHPPKAARFGTVSVSKHAHLERSSRFSSRLHPRPRIPCSVAYSGP